MNNREVIIAGAAPDSGNLGVSALCHSVVSELLNIDSDYSVTVLDYGDGFRRNAYRLNGERACNLMGVKSSRNFLKQSAFSNIEFLSKTGLLLSKTSRVMKSARAILDVSAGDSFTDLYGPARFNARIFPKQYAINHDIPLVLLPQTYGPFINEASQKIAREIMPGCQLAYARDKYSFEIMKELLGSHFDPEKHKLGVDAAFLLEVHEPDFSAEPELNYPSEKEIFGFNVSGLIFNDAAVAKSQYGINIDYPKVMKSSIEYILSESDGEVWLIPHVISKNKFDYESDTYASMKLKESLDDQFKPRVHVLSGQYDQCSVKGFISKLNWFCGMRMHSTIAGLSTCVPTVNLAYSDKSLGVFESAGQKDKVLDARHLETDELIERLKAVWAIRNDTRQELAAFIPSVKQKAREQILDIVKFL